MNDYVDIVKAFTEQNVVIQTHICARMYKHTHTHHADSLSLTHTHTLTHMYMYMHTHTGGLGAQTWTTLFKWPSRTCTHTHMCVYVCKHTHTHTHTHMHTYTHIYTYIHRQYMGLGHAKVNTTLLKLSRPPPSSTCSYTHTCVRIYTTYTYTHTHTHTHTHINTHTYIYIYIQGAWARKRDWLCWNRRGLHRPGRTRRRGASSDTHESGWYFKMYSAGYPIDYSGRFLSIFRIYREPSGTLAVDQIFFRTPLKARNLRRCRVCCQSYLLDRKFMLLLGIQGSIEMVAYAGIRV